jgi:hypothetical protein
LQPLRPVRIEALRIWPMQRARTEISRGFQVVIILMHQVEEEKLKQSVIHVASHELGWLLMPRAPTPRCSLLLAAQVSCERRDTFPSTPG